VVRRASARSRRRDLGKDGDDRVRLSRSGGDAQSVASRAHPRRLERGQRRRRGGGHVEFALGTQTLGSVLRPASFCGVVGFKPTYGAIPTEGVWPLAPSLDHVGILAKDVATASRAARVLLPQLGAAQSHPPRLRVDVTLNCDRYGQAAHDAAIASLILAPDAERS